MKNKSGGYLIKEKETQINQNIPMILEDNNLYTRQKKNLNLVQFSQTSQKTKAQQKYQTKRVKMRKEAAPWEGANKNKNKNLNFFSKPFFLNFFSLTNNKNNDNTHKENEEHQIQNSSHFNSCTAERVTPSYNSVNSGLKRNNKGIKFLLWNSRSLNKVKQYYIRSRTEDVIVINETWLDENATNIEFPGYTSIRNDRLKKHGGGVAIFIKEEAEIKIVSDEIAETLLIKILFDRNKFLYIMTSYFPNSGNSEKKRIKRWWSIKNMLLMNCSENSFENIVMACDWNINLMSNHELQKDFEEMNCKIINYEDSYSYKSGKNESKIDFFVVSNNLLKIVNATQSLLCQIIKHLPLKSRKLKKYL